MVHRFARAGVGALVAVLIAGASSASAAHKTKGYPDTPKGAIADCSAGHYPLKGRYTIAVLQKALKSLPSGSLQYTTCADALVKTIQKEELAAHHKHSGGGKSGRHRVTRGSHSAGTPKRKTGRAGKPLSGGGSPVVLPATGQTVAPGTVTVHGASFLSNLPAPLLIVLAALLATVLAVSARAINNLVHARRTH